MAELNMEAERTAFETVVRRVTHANDASFKRDLDDESDYEDHMMSMYWLLWREARPAPTHDKEDT